MAYKLIVKEIENYDKDQSPDKINFDKEVTSLLEKGWELVPNSFSVSLGQKSGIFSKSVDTVIVSQALINKDLIGEFTNA